MNLCIDCGEPICAKSTRCSYCRGIAAKVHNFCIDCGKEITLASTRCGSCAAIHNRGSAQTRPPYNLNFQQIAAKIRERDGHRCQRCGKQRRWAALPVHHINGNHLDDRESNLITLCRQCHAEVHRNGTRRAHLLEASGAQ